MGQQGQGCMTGTPLVPRPVALGCRSGVPAASSCFGESLLWHGAYVTSVPAQLLLMC